MRRFSIPSVFWVVIFNAIYFNSTATNGNKTRDRELKLEFISADNDTNAYYYSPGE